MEIKKVYPTKLYIRILARVVFFCYTKIYGIKKNMPSEIENIKTPFLVLSNHAGFWDPFVVGSFLKPFTHFVSSDAAFRSPFMRFFLTRLGTIPKKKNMRDTKVIRDIASVIRQGECVGLFPEAVRTWAGESLAMDFSIAKLIKLLNVPVVGCVIKGMNLFHPRWSRKIRPVKMEVEYKLLFTPDQIKELDDIHIFSILQQSIYLNDVEFQRQKMNKIRSKHKAEFINHTLFVCPDCHSIDSFFARGNSFHCVKCHYDIAIDDYGFFKRKSKGILFFDNILDWYKWQEKWMIQFIYFKFDSQFNQIIFEDKDSLVYHSNDNGDFKFLGNADIQLHINRIDILYKTNPGSLTLNFDDLKTINPQVNERLEIFYGQEAYRIVGSRNGVSALKWEVALNAIWKRLGQEHKISAYLKPNL